MAMNLIKKVGKITWIDPADGSKSSKSFNLYSDVEAEIKTGFDAIVSLTANETADYSYQENYEIV
jgi:predicted DNA-binding ArsR family transcriptional regulator